MCKENGGGIQMRLFKLLECFEDETEVKIMNSSDMKILFTGKVGDMPHRISRMKNVKLGSCKVKNEVLCVYTEKCLEDQSKA